MLLVEHFSKLIGHHTYQIVDCVDEQFRVPCTAAGINQ
ncbi:hypothetical protein BTN50_1694 (plasmid) [Candidatus Enterovibrio altilux]|uniref:Uncharacterized protein n=1 Tax=Candidatus Enterovibrio altilux TaxID=1927128 RepID=A0A291BAU2_9GAMM|nr:hypothetical protein BTN50_1694 [Candidatus Enterovibrio luxaltus]